MASDNNKKSFKSIGKVISIVGNKTVKVMCSYPVLHECGKMVNKRRKFICHDESLALKVGDTVFVVPTNHISKSKSHLAIIS